MPEYRSWQQVAGYFDGDGTISISDTSNQPYKLGLSVAFVDQSVDQIETVRRFLRDRGVWTSRVLKTSKGTACMIAVSRFVSVRKALARMKPHLCKKEIEATAALAYYNGEITGNDLAGVFRREVEAGRRERRPRKIPINVPYTYSEGNMLMEGARRIKLRDAIGRYRTKVTSADYQGIRDAYFGQAISQSALARDYPQYSRETIRRIVGKGRGRVLVKGMGMVETSDKR